MTAKILACATLLLTACCGTQNPNEAAKAPVTRTEVKHGDQIALVTPDLKAGMTVNEALANRQSWRQFAPEALSLEELSGVMWASAGVNRPESGRLTAPSAMALYPVSVYAIFTEGIYSYDAKAQKLIRVVEGDHRKLAGLQDFVYTAPLNLIYIADAATWEGKNVPADKMRFYFGLDAAGYAQNVNVYTAGHNLKSITRGGAQDAELIKVLGLDPQRYFFVLAQTVGK